VIVPEEKVVEEIGCTSLYSSAMHVFLWYTNPMITNRMCTHYNTTILVMCVVGILMQSIWDKIIPFWRLICT